MISLSTLTKPAESPGQGNYYTTLYVVEGSVVITPRDDAATRREVVLGPR
jgi:hypothetical protein